MVQRAKTGYEVRKITAIDQDLGRPRGIGYTIISGNTNSVFSLNYISGSLTVNGQLDRENPLYSAGFSLTVKATELKEDRSPSEATVKTTFTILLIDRNDNAPTFNRSEYRVLITELAQVGFALPLFIQAEDKDEGVNGMFQVVLRGNHSEYFTISPTAVQGRADIRVRVALPLDYENIRSYSFSLYANESMSDHVGFARVFIELVNDNDNRPIFSRPLYNISLPEDSRAGTSLLRVLHLPQVGSQTLPEVLVEVCRQPVQQELSQQPSDPQQRSAPPGRCWHRGQLSLGAQLRKVLKQLVNASLWLSSF
ncbi:cadherin-23-like [Pseudoliparis swirei]|uniref:cadherin-23-like n=1 Tax=Pseudoliparis swirei TaxID=2059687 RepID=UPI0024BEB706|nr:cadherin-23-like [Pseudoliparis swirei]